MALAWRDLAVRYKQTVISVAWALIRPLPDRADFHNRVRPYRQAAVRWNGALRVDGLCRNAPLDLLRDWPSGCQPRG